MMNAILIFEKVVSYQKESRLVSWESGKWSSISDVHCSNLPPLQKTGHKPRDCKILARK